MGRIIVSDKVTLDGVIQDPAGEVAQEVSELKQKLTGDIIVPASFQLVEALIEHELVDEVRLKVLPIVLGAGRRLFGETSHNVPMHHLGTQTFDDGIV